MAYTHDPATDEGLLRSLIYDSTQIGSPTKGVDYYFEDAELTAILDLNSDDLWGAASDACSAMAANFAKEAIIVGLGKQDIYVDLKKKSDFYIQLAKIYSSRSTKGVAEYVDSFSYDMGVDGTDSSEYVGDD